MESCLSTFLQILLWSYSVNCIDKWIFFRVFSSLHKRPLGRDRLFVQVHMAGLLGMKSTKTHYCGQQLVLLCTYSLGKLSEFVCTHLFKIHVSLYREIRKGSKFSGAFTLKIRKIQPSAGTILFILRVQEVLQKLRQDEIWVRRRKYA